METEKHILVVFSFHNSIFNGIFVIKHTWRDPLSESAATFDHFFSFFSTVSVGWVLSFFFFFSSSFTSLCWLGSFFLFFFLFLFCHWSPLAGFWSFFSFFFFFGFGEFGYKKKKKKAASSDKYKAHKQLKNIER